MFLEKEKSTTDRILPKLSSVLQDRSITELESEDGRTIFQYFKEYANPGLLVDAKLGGSNVDLVSAARIHRYVGSLCPSLAIMMTMHNHTTYCLSRAMDSSLAAKDMVLTGVAQDNLIFCSGFAEARPGENILSSSVTCQLEGDGYLVNGSKKPCSMTDFADLALVGVSNPRSDDPTARGLLIVEDMGADNISKIPFWPSDLLTATASNQLKFEGLYVAKDNVVLMEEGENPEKAKQEIETTELMGLSSFQILIASSYLGVASRLATMCFSSESANATDLSQMAIELEAAAFALEGAAMHVESQAPSEEMVALCISARTMVAQCIDRANRLALLTLGGMKYLGKEDVRYLLQVTNCLNFHPLSRNESIELVRHELCRSPI